ncbi:hypothetical protein DPMN_009036 [Dreissena polymorpha]|uniref:Uncharacterized protein n=1 Tax=Dreissena polymorpha TaxID=45954 RepID=A0A9D4N0I3_DREPO|nr:hypothetical protein DPMN_009036 [Dreissena polymorpha]
MFGRTPKLPIDAMFEEPETNNNKLNQEYVCDLKERMSKAREVASRFIENAQTKQKKYYDNKAKATRLNIGDNVMF